MHLGGYFGGEGGSIRATRGARRRRAGPALLLAAALVAVVGSAEAQPPPPAGSVRPLGVPVDPANPGLFDYFWDAATRAFTPVDDFVRVAPGATVDLHMRANDVVG
ncbi:MAG: hypothetical protein OXG47_08260, partial [bacterium]|nr:hypothetical protein [bacterium]